MEGAFQIIAMHLAANAHMRAQMAAIGVQHPHLAVFATPDRQITIEIAQRLDFADRQFVGEQRNIPAVAIGNVEVAFFDRAALGHFGHAPFLQRIAFQLFQHLPDGNRWCASISR